MKNNNSSLNRNNTRLFPNNHKEHSWGPYGILAFLYTLCGLAWFGTMVASLAYSNDSDNINNNNNNNNNGGINNNNNNQQYGGNMLQMFYSFFNLFAFRTICLFASLMVTYNADRHYLSRGAGWTSWVVNLCLLFSWLSTDLPFVYSALVSYTDNGQGVNNGQSGINSSLNAHFCSGDVPSHWCRLNYTHAILSIVAGGLIGLTWLYSCYQLKRARGVSNLLLTWPEVAVINFIVFGILGYIVWTCATIQLAITRNYSVFQYLESGTALNTYRMFVPSQIWGNYLIHAVFIFSLASVSYISFGGTTAPRMAALIVNWLSFMILFPSFLYIARHQNEEKVGQCANDRMNGDLRCPTLDGVAAGLGISMACNFMIGLIMMAVLKQVETADYAVDMYGDKALAVDAVKSTGSIPIADPHYATTRPTTPEANQRNTHMNYNDNINRDVEMGRPIVA